LPQPRHRREWSFCHGVLAIYAIPSKDIMFAYYARM
jgi:hypothetical protein